MGPFYSLPASRPLSTCHALFVLVRYYACEAILLTKHENCVTCEFDTRFVYRGQNGQMEARLEIVEGSQSTRSECNLCTDVYVYAIVLFIHSFTSTTLPTPLNPIPISFHRLQAKLPYVNRMSERVLQDSITHRRTVRSSETFHPPPHP